MDSSSQSGGLCIRIPAYLSRTAGLIVLAQRALIRFPLRHVEVSGIIERIPGNEFLHERKLTTVPPGKDHHASQYSTVVSDNLAELAHTISTGGDIVERHEPLAWFDRADRDVRPDPSGLATVRRQRHAQSHRVGEGIRNSFGEQLRGRGGCNEAAYRMALERPSDPFCHVPGQQSDQLWEACNGLEPQIGGCGWPDTTST